VAAVAVAAALAWSLPGGRPPVPRHRTPESARVPVAPVDARRNASRALAPATVDAMGLADDAVGWAADGDGLYLTTDRGAVWRTITPPNLADQDVSDRIGALDAVGRDDLWLPLEDVPGLVPYSQSTDGSVRGEGIDRSTDGGQTWTFTALPGCLQGCGADLGVDFVDPEHGFATTGPSPSSSTLVYSTDDGGTTWVRLAGSLPGWSAQVTFTSVLDGWAVSGPAFGRDGRSTSPGGVLFRTTDGGMSWSPARGLPSGDRFGLPTFFGHDVGVVVSNPEGAPGRATSVFVTEDGGVAWRPRRLPDIPGLRDFEPRGLGSRFAAPGPEDWKIDTGSSVFTTTDAGRTWTQATPRPRSAPGSVSSVVFSTPRDGLAVTLPPGCTGLTTVPDGRQCFPTLVVSTDGGRHWSPVRP